MFHRSLQLVVNIYISFLPKTEPFSAFIIPNLFVVVVVFYLYIIVEVGSGIEVERERERRKEGYHGKGQKEGREGRQVRRTCLQVLSTFGT